MDSKFKELSTREMSLVEKLLDAAPKGREELRTQLNSIKGEQIESDGTLRLRCLGGVPSEYYARIRGGLQRRRWSGHRCAPPYGEGWILVHAGDHQV